MMGGPAGQVEAVRTYALRSLHGCAPEQVLPEHCKRAFCLNIASTVIQDICCTTSHA